MSGGRSSFLFANTLVGVAAAFLAWVLLVPWDLSERADGRRSGDDFAPEIAAVGICVTVAALGIALVERTRSSAVPFAVGGLWCWAAMFAWRAGTADVVSGANFFMVPLLFLFLPCAILVPVVIGVLAQRLDRSVAQRR